MKINVRAKNLNNFYICSFSSKSIIYKGMFWRRHCLIFRGLKRQEFNLDTLYFIKDFQTQHQVGDLAQPFRSIAHNGEINTLKGNINWMKVHEQEMFSSKFEVWRI